MLFAKNRARQIIEDASESGENVIIVSVKLPGKNATELRVLARRCFEAELLNYGERRDMLRFLGGVGCSRAVNRRGRTSLIIVRSSDSVPTLLRRMQNFILDERPRVGSPAPVVVTGDSNGVRKTVAAFATNLSEETVQKMIAKGKTFVYHPFAPWAVWEKQSERWPSRFVRLPVAAYTRTPIPRVNL